jgi:hypothetical protein
MDGIGGNDGYHVGRSRVPGYQLILTLAIFGRIELGRKLVGKQSKWIVIGKLNYEIKKLFRNDD